MADCRSCGQEIEWATVQASGKNIPLDPDEDDAGNIKMLDMTMSNKPVVRVVRKGQGTRVSHFATCPQANDWRQR